MNLDAKYPDIIVPLTGKDGNIFSILGRVRRALRTNGESEDTLSGFTAEISSAESYDEAIQIVMRWVDVT